MNSHKQEKCAHPSLQLYGGKQQQVLQPLL